MDDFRNEYFKEDGIVFAMGVYPYLSVDMAKQGLFALDIEELIERRISTAKEEDSRFSAAWWNYSYYSPHDFFIVSPKNEIKIVKSSGIMAYFGVATLLGDKIDLNSPEIAKELFEHAEGFSMYAGTPFDEIIYGLTRRAKMPKPYQLTLNETSTFLEVTLKHEPLSSELPKPLRVHMAYSMGVQELQYGAGITFAKLGQSIGAAFMPKTRQSLF
ncbi:MAG: hypothetical protein NDI94_00505 [Candidatus Woesearchaeota archaeon]|nr:hypothetical protein [Candidatus Woesearchaeota archaeon]